MDQVRKILQGFENAPRVTNQDACLSAEQSNKLNTILELLKERLPAKPEQMGADAVDSEATHFSDDVEMDKNTHEISDSDRGLQVALDRLCQYANENEKMVFSAEADAIIRDIENIFSLYSNVEVKEKHTENQKGKRRGESSESGSDDDDLQYQHEVKRMKGLLIASNGVAINHKGCRKMLCEF